MRKLTDFAPVEQIYETCCWWNTTECVFVDNLRFDPWATGDEYKRMLTVGDFWEPIYNATEGYEDEIIKWKRVESCYASDDGDCKYYEDCYHTQRFRCNENHRIAIKFDQFDVRITKDLACYDHLAFKFIKQSKSVFNKTSEDYNKWIMDTYVPIDLCGTPSTETNDTFFPWEWTIIDYDAIEVTFETDILELKEEWPKNKPRHSGFSVNFRCMTGNETSSFPYSTRFLGNNDASHNDSLRYSTVFGESIRYVWAHDQGNHYVKNRYDYVNGTNDDDDDDSESATRSNFIRTLYPNTESPLPTFETHELKDIEDTDKLNANDKIVTDELIIPTMSLAIIKPTESIANEAETDEPDIPVPEFSGDKVPNVFVQSNSVKMVQSNCARYKIALICVLLTIFVHF